MGILHKKVIGFNSTFLAVVILQILIKYLLHASHDLGNFPVKMHFSEYVGHLYTCLSCQRLVHLELNLL